MAGTTKSRSVWRHTSKCRRMTRMDHIHIHIHEPRGGDKGTPDQDAENVGFGSNIAQKRCTVAKMKTGGPASVGDGRTTIRKRSGRTKSVIK